jgi:hypothetical protein
MAKLKQPIKRLSSVKAHKGWCDIKLEAMPSNKMPANKVCGVAVRECLLDVGRRHDEAISKQVARTIMAICRRRC